MDISSLLQALVGSFAGTADAAPAGDSFSDRFAYAVPGISPPMNGTLEGRMPMPPPPIEGPADPMGGAPMPRPRPQIASDIPFEGPMPTPPFEGPMPPPVPMPQPRPPQAGMPPPAPPTMPPFEGPMPPPNPAMAQGGAPGPGMPPDATPRRTFLGLDPEQWRRISNSAAGGLSEVRANRLPGEGLARGLGGSFAGAEKFDSSQDSRRQKALDSAIKLRGQDQVNEYRMGVLDERGTRTTRGGALANSARERIIGELMRRDPRMSYQDALALSQRAPRGRDEILSRERIAATVARSDPMFAADPVGTIRRYREVYGLPAEGGLPAEPRPQQPNQPPARGGAGAEPPPRPAANRPDMMTPGDGGAPLKLDFPARPDGVPRGSGFNFNRRTWKSPDGAEYDENGQRIEGR